MALVLIFKSSSNLAAAYGIAVTLTMLITTMLFYVVALEVFHWSKAKAMLICGLFGLVELVFFGANVLKIPKGGWFPLVVGALVFTVLTTWFRGRQLVAARLNQDRVSLETLVEQVDKDQIGRTPGTAVYLYSAGGLAPPPLLSNLRHNNVLHEQILVASVTTTQQAHEQHDGSTRAAGRGVPSGQPQVRIPRGTDRRRRSHCRTGVRPERRLVLPGPRDGAGVGTARYGPLAGATVHRAVPQRHQRRSLLRSPARKR